MTVEAIDVSHWQATTPPLTGLGLLAARSSYGKYGDGSYPLHAGNARAARLILVAYGFGRNPDATGDSVRDQVAAFLRVGGAADGFALDVEPDGGRPRMTDPQASEFVDRVHQTGREIGVYMSESAFRLGLGQDWNWVANWSTRPRIPFRLHQYRGGPMDRDRFYGDLSTLRALFSPTEEPDAMNGWTAPDKPTILTLPKGSAIYRDSEFSIDKLNVTATSAEHEVIYLGKTRNSRRELVWIVSYDNPDDTSGWRAHFLKDRAGGYTTKVVSSTPIEPPPPPNIDAEIAEAGYAGFDEALDEAGRVVAAIPRRSTAAKAEVAGTTDARNRGGMPKEVI